MKIDAMKAGFYKWAQREICPYFTHSLFYVYKYFRVNSLDTCGIFDDLCIERYGLLNRMDLILSTSPPMKSNLINSVTMIKSVCGAPIIFF